MAKISTYPSVTPTSEDYVIGTDASNLLITKTFKIGNITALLTLDQVLTNGNTSGQDIILNGSVTLGGGLIDSLGGLGAAGQVLVSTGTKTEWQDASGSTTLTKLLEGSSVDSLQVPVGLDTPLKVSFGAAQGIITDDVMISADGIVTFNQAGQYYIDVELSVVRQGAGTLSYSLVRGLLNSVTVGVPTTIGLTVQEYFPYKKRFTINAAATDTFEVQFMRDSSGANDGFLSRFLGAGGFAGTPSAFIQIWKA